MNTPASSFRLSETAIDLLYRICSSLGMKRTAVLELAIRQLAKKHGVSKEEVK